jgi:uncharacterized tellurite resistance protein B-like protein
MTKDNFHYLHSLHKLAAVDGKVSAEERGYLKAVASKLGVSLREIERSREAEPWLKIADPSLRKLLLKDLFFVSYADGRRNPIENKFIQKVIESYQLPRKVVTEIDGFVKQGIAWIERGQKLFGMHLDVSSRSE